jgi:hypothetical protein
LIRRFSSRRQQLDTTFLNERLQGALAYHRIAGYFSSSVLEVAGEALESIQGPIMVVCNSDLDVRDVETAKAASQALRYEWCAAEPEKLGIASQPRFIRLYQLLRSGKLQVRVLPAKKFGLAHGKAGVITLADGSQTAFIGSINETHAAWKVNYEILWEDNSPEAVNWVEEEFQALWNSPFAVPLSEFIIEDIGRISRRTVIPDVDAWQQDAEPAAAVIEAPVFRRENGLLEHQKYFVKLAFDAHCGPFGAHFILADMVGLGKTVQLALAAQLMALSGDRPVLVLVPKTLIWQWQDEMCNMLDMPSAVWNGKQWVDEVGIEYPIQGPAGIKKCPRRVGVVSQGLITRESEAAGYLKELSYECIIVDEAHRARRKKFGPHPEEHKPEPNNLLAFLCEIADCTKSLLLATATPVQIHPIEAFDLMRVLAEGNESVLGNAMSMWRKPNFSLDVVMGKNGLPDSDSSLWSWIRNPLPPASEGHDFELIRRSLKMPDAQAVAAGDTWMQLKEPDCMRVRRLAHSFAADHNPFIRHIIRRTREFLEQTINPETGEPYLKPIAVKLYGDNEADAIRLPLYLQDAFKYAEQFCELLKQRLQAAGFLKTLLLRRMGSSIYAGRQTVERMLSNWTDIGEDEANEDDDNAGSSELRQLTTEERQVLEAILASLDSNQEGDPKYEVVLRCLFEMGWLEQGCIIFSQYYDSVFWLAGQLTARLPDEPIGIYTGSQRSGIFHGGHYTKAGRDELKQLVRTGELRLLLGTDAASEGINLQRLGTLINLDLPWNPTRLEQRKGRIRRIGQVRDTVYIYNMRYKGSVEDRVHELLSDRLEDIFRMFGQIPDVLEDVWINIALGDLEKARQIIDEVPKRHPFEIRYDKIEAVPWESCSQVLDSSERQTYLKRGW